jgi:hypothetical protein
MGLGPRMGDAVFGFQASEAGAETAPGLVSFCH